MAIKFLIIDGAKGKEIISGYNKVYSAWEVKYKEWKDKNPNLTITRDPYYICVPHKLKDPQELGLLKNPVFQEGSLFYRISKKAIKTRYTDYQELVNSYPDFRNYIQINTEVNLSAPTIVVRDGRTFVQFSSCSKDEKTNTIFIKYMYDENSKKKITLPSYIKEVKESKFLELMGL